MYRGGNALPYRGYNPSVFSACKTSRKASSLLRGRQGRPAPCAAVSLGRSRGRSRAVHRFGLHPIYPPQCGHRSSQSFAAAKRWQMTAPLTLRGAEWVPQIFAWWERLKSTAETLCRVGDSLFLSATPWLPPSSSEEGQPLRGCADFRSAGGAVGEAETLYRVRGIQPLSLFGL